MKTIFKQILFGASLALLASCADLDIVPLSELASGNWYTTETEIKMSIDDWYRPDFFQIDEFYWSDDCLYRDRENEVLFMDLRQMGIPFEKKYVELDQETRDTVVRTFHNWQQQGHEQTYRDEPEYCYSATRDEIAQKGYSLVPSKYIEFRNRDEQVDFDAKMRELQAEMRELLQQEEKSKEELKVLFDKLGYKIY